MRIMIRYQDQRTVEAVLLAANQERMRIAIASQGDATELTLNSEYWLTDKSEQVEIEALITIDGLDVSHFCAEIYPRTMTAGQVPVSD